ncbi:hypothetical protein BC30090_1150 [Bacillus cereus]|nr:hypothetical protein BC30090_1150 [Bacillus cereus]CJP96772.1 Uncharacterised protein [Streptococcus pneumoniae]CKF34497.1 Uncharacterised protein [Streptococcus pneumoniae]CRI00326.1 Uncharacterised protein [Streptococcus pneumoniae]
MVRIPTIFQIKLFSLITRDKAGQPIYFPYKCLLKNVIQHYDYVEKKDLMIEFTNEKAVKLISVLLLSKNLSDFFNNNGCTRTKS